MPSASHCFVYRRTLDMEEEMLKKDGVAILIVMVFIALLGLFGYWYGLFKQDDIITNEVYFEHVPAEPVPLLRTTTTP